MKARRYRSYGISGGRRVEVQVFGTNKNQDTRRALRFWSERRVKVHFVDLNERAASKGELQRFVQKFGLTPLIDKASKRYEALGLSAGRYSDEKWLQILSDEPLVLAQPLTRWGTKLTVGLSEDDWKAWLASERNA
jgi:arsenate reductase (glutaredoxin)